MNNSASSPSSPLSSAVESDYTFESLQTEVEALRQRLNTLRLNLSRYFIAKDEVIDLMVVCTLAQEPLLLVGPPGTAKSDLILKFVQAIGLEQGEYFEYMLTKFTEPSEIIGPVDINKLKEGRYLRRVSGKLPESRVAFLDEIFKSNSAILNTLLTIINERKYYQDGQPVPVNMKMLFAATNEIPELAELGALKDRFTMKIESGSVMENHFDELLEFGLANESYKAFNQRPWANLASLEDFLKLKVYLDHLMVRRGDQAGDQTGDQTGDGRSSKSSKGSDRSKGGKGDLGGLSDPYFPEPVFVLFKRIIKTLQREDKLEISDRKVIKLYKLIRARAFLFHGGVVTKDDLVMLRYIPDRLQDFTPVREKVDALLKLEG